MKETFRGRRRWVLTDSPPVMEVIAVFPPMKQAKYVSFIPLCIVCMRTDLLSINLWHILLYTHSLYLVKFQCATIDHCLCNYSEVWLWSVQWLCMWIISSSVVIALFPGPAQLFVPCSKEKQEEPAWYLFSHEQYIIIGKVLELTGYVSRIVQPSMLGVYKSRLPLARYKW